jgi:hypothetical protein
MAGFYFIIANLILLGVNIVGVMQHNPVIGFVSAVLLTTAGITGKLTKNTIIFLFWLSIGLAALYAGMGALALVL